jgi:large subunit ribosomal protein L29
MKIAQIRELTDAELVKQCEDSRQELLTLRIQGRIGQLTNSARIPLVRRTIARVLSVQRERQTTKT